MQVTDSEKLEALYRLYEKPMYRIAYAVLHQHEQAEDAVHDAFCRVIRHIRKLGTPDAPETKAYMISVIRSTAINQYRKNERENAHTVRISEETVQIADPEDALQTHIHQSALQQTVNSLLSGLADTDRSIILLHCRDGLTFAEIGSALHISEQAARKRFERARRHLKSQKGTV